MVRSKCVRNWEFQNPRENLDPDFHVTTSSEKKILGQYFSCAAPHETNSREGKTKTVELWFFKKGLGHSSGNYLNLRYVGTSIICYRAIIEQKFQSTFDTKFFLSIYNLLKLSEFFTEEKVKLSRKIVLFARVWFCNKNQ